MKGKPLMKRKFTALLLILMLILTSCGRTPVECKHADIDGNGLCEFCGGRIGSAQLPTECNHSDINNDGICELCDLMIGEIPAPPEDTDCAHTDDDDNGVCEKCDYRVFVTVDLYAINDLHGKFDDSDTDIGVDELTSYLKNSSSKDEYSVFLSSGDMWQGSSESNLTGGLIITEWMNELDFASMTLGNHEYDWGEELVKKNAEAAEFPFLGINIYDKETNKRVEYCEASATVDLGPVQIGIIGAIGDCYSSISSDKVDGIYFKTGDELSELVKAEAHRLRSEGVDVIVYSLHDGYGRSSSGIKNITGNQISSYYSPSLSRDTVDVAFEAHTHQNYVLRDSYGVYHMQGGGDNDGITHTELRVNFVTGSVEFTTAEFIKESEYDELEGDSIVDELLVKYAEQIAKGEVVCGINNATRGSTYIKNLVAQLYYEYGVEKWGEEYDIALGGGFISVRSPYELPAGEVKYSQLGNLLPFDNEILLCSISGKDLLSKFINTQNSNYYIYRGDEREIDPNATYYIITDSYCAQYAPNRLTVIASYGADIYARDLVAEYIKNGGLE